MRAPYRIEKGGLPSFTDVRKDVNVILLSMRLHNIRRYINQAYWSDESRDALYADKLEKKPRLETVSEHSWHVADTALLLADHFPYLNVGHCLKLAILHDKMEIFVGDLNPLGRDGTGEKGHAFDVDKQLSKHERERLAIETYIARLRPSVRTAQRVLLLEMLELASLEARFIKAIDKMQALAFIHVKKRGVLDDKHIQFLVKFSAKNEKYFPGLKRHHDELLRRLFSKVGEVRGITLSQVWEIGTSLEEQPTLFEEQASLDLPPIETEQRAKGGSSRRDRVIREALSEIGRLEPACNGLEAYRQVSETLNRVEDARLGREHWSPPRHYPPGITTERLYPIAPESFYAVPGYAGVTLAVSTEHLLFISRYGAMELQRKDSEDTFGQITRFNGRSERVIFTKPDAFGHDVWHRKNRR